MRRALLLFAGALLVRIVYYLMIRNTACLDINLDPISDMETFHRWALSIVNGDWLGRLDFHPFHPWQAAVASKEQWARWYGHVYHQEPFYPYFVAVLYLFAPREPSSVILVQLLLGAAGCSLTYLAARRLMTEGAALTAGILSTLYGPYLYYESLMLRDSLMIPLNALILWVVLEARASESGRRATAWWLGSGLLIGMAYITKASILPFFILLVLLTLFDGRTLPMSRRSTPAAAMLAGFLLMVSPVLARNLAVGAPLMKITTRGPIEFINGNNPWHMGIGWFDGDDTRVSVYAHDLLAESDGKLLPTAAAVLRGWSDHPARLIWLQLVKAGYFFAPFEMPNNASYSYFRLNNPLLRHATLSFYWISPLALIGLIVSLRRCAVFMPLYLFLSSGILVTIVFYVIARFRAPFMPALIILAALGLWSIVELVKASRWSRLLPYAALLAGCFVVNTLETFPDEGLVRPQDYLISIQGYLSRGNDAAALAEAGKGRRIFPGFADFPRAEGRIYLRQNRRAEALAAFREAAAEDPADEESRREVTYLERQP
jgi:4-amino-4-deoxy-L-arabinose transferase-like glycosyltransferase